MRECFKNLPKYACRPTSGMSAPLFKWLEHSAVDYQVVVGAGLVDRGTLPREELRNDNGVIGASLTDRSTVSRGSLRPQDLVVVAELRDIQVAGNLGEAHSRTVHEVAGAVLIDLSTAPKELVEADFIAPFLRELDGVCAEQLPDNRHVVLLLRGGIETIPISGMGIPRPDGDAAVKHVIGAIQASNGVIASCLNKTGSSTVSTTPFLAQLNQVAASGSLNDPRSVCTEPLLDVHLLSSAFLLTPQLGAHAAAAAYLGKLESTSLHLRKSGLSASVYGRTSRTENGVRVRVRGGDCLLNIRCGSSGLFNHDFLPESHARRNDESEYECRCDSEELSHGFKRVGLSTSEIAGEGSGGGPRRTAGLNSTAPMRLRGPSVS